MSTQFLNVQLKQNPYQIAIGENIYDALKEFLSKHYKDSRLCIVTDSTVADYHLRDLKQFLTAVHSQPFHIVLPAGEQTKSIFYLEKTVHFILKNHFERNDVILAFGGGVIGDLAGLAASITKRSMPFIQIPTTLLAQIDSSIGGKTGINCQYGKNLIGSFYQPSFVLSDIKFLSTLGKRQLLAGYAEMLKYSLINNPEFLQFLDINFEQLFTNKDLLQKAIFTSAQSKVTIVEKDEFEYAERALLNLGHSFAHALEAYLEYNPQKIIHGEAVAIGMVLAFEFSAHLNLCPQEDVQKLKQHLQKTDLPTNITDLPQKICPESLFEIMQQDKKMKRGKINLILAHGIGKAFLAHDIDPEKLLQFLRTKV